MAEKMLDCAGVRRSSSHLTSMYGKDFLELVWQKGEILVQGGSSATIHNCKTPSFNIGYSITPSSHSQETIDHEVGCITKRPRLSTLFSVLDMPTPTSYQSRPRTMDSTQTPSSTNSHKQNLGSYQPKTGGKVNNFSNFAIPPVFLKPTYHQGNRAMSTSNNKTQKIVVAAAATSCKSAKGSHGFKEQTALAATNSSKPVYVFARSLEQPPHDEHSQAQFYNPTSSSESLRGQAKANTNFVNEPLVASSSVCSFGASKASNFCSKNHEDTDDSIYLSDNDEEPKDAVKEKLASEGAIKGKRSRNSETHNLSERKRRDKINKKMRTLKELIPNCNKMDKASMLDDAIEYLKALKLQLQMLSMGSGLCLPFMMLPAAAHHINTSNLPHQLMGGGMIFRPGTGIPFSPPQFPIPPLPSFTDNGLQMMFGFPNQVPPMPMSHAPFIPMIGKPSSQPLSEQLTNSTHLTTQQVSDPRAKADCAPNQVLLNH